MIESIADMNSMALIKNDDTAWRRTDWRYGSSHEDLPGSLKQKARFSNEKRALVFRRRRSVDRNVVEQGLIAGGSCSPAAEGEKSSIVVAEPILSALPLTLPLTTITAVTGAMVI